MAKRKIRQLTTSNYDFPTLAQSKESKYVDKTDLLYELASAKDEAQYFIARPRRFGKSLMLSTLKAMFEGRRDLFKGLKLDGLPWECWDEKRRYHVYSFTMSNANGATYEKFHGALRKLTIGLLAQVGQEYDDTVDPSLNFDVFLKAAAKKSPTRKIVVLIDEYDEPVAKFLNDLETLDKVRNLLHDFYEKLKSNSGSIRLLMMTGVTKLTKLSVFSGLNHLKDLSMDRRYATLLGYTPQELDGALRENVEAFGRANKKNFKAAKKALLDWYDGYRFSPDSKRRVCNPVSIASAFDAGKLEGYWNATGGSSLIMGRIEKSGKLPADLENIPADKATLDVCDAATLPMEALLYQGGYLTIRDVTPGPPDKYTLAPPTLEVREALKRGYISQILHANESKFNALLDQAKKLIGAGDVREVVETMLFSLYAQIPPDWRIRDEAEAKRYFQLFFSMLGAAPAPEFTSARGYADAVIETPRDVFVFEFKYKRSSKAAIKQIRDRGYADKWKGDKRPVTLIGVNFNPAQRNIDIPVIEPL